MFGGHVGNRENAGNFIQEDKARSVLTARLQFGFLLLMNGSDMWNSVRFQTYHLDLRSEKVLSC